MHVLGKRFNVAWVQGQVGVQSRNFSDARLYSTGWQARFPLVKGIKRTYPWSEAEAVGGRAAEAAWRLGIMGWPTSLRAL